MPSLTIYIELPHDRIPEGAVLDASLLYSCEDGLSRISHMKRSLCTLVLVIVKTK